MKYVTCPATLTELHASLYMNPVSEFVLNDECTWQNLVVSSPVITQMRHVQRKIRSLRFSVDHELGNSIDFLRFIRDTFQNSQPVGHV